MAIGFPGRWRGTVVGRNAGFSQRTLVSGGSAGNGPYNGVVRPPPCGATSTASSAWCPTSSPAGSELSRPPATRGPVSGATAALALTDAITRLPETQDLPDEVYARRSASSPTTSTTPSPGRSL